MIGITIVVPAYNEEQGIRAVLDQTYSVLEGSGLNYEIIVVDDGSRDDTAAVAEAHEGVRVLRHPSNRGYGAALKTGIRHARYDLIAITDGDGTYPNERIPDLVARLVQGDHDMVVGARTGQQVSIPLMRRPAKWAIGKLGNLVAGERIPDINSGLVVTAMLGLLSVGPLAVGQSAQSIVFMLAGGLTLSFLLFWLDATYCPAASLGRRLGAVGQRLFSESSWLVQMRSGLKQLSLTALTAATLLTAIAYFVLFLQSYLIAVALGVPLSFWQVAYAMAIGSVVTLLPISVSGLGTREAAVVAFLGTHGVPANLALGFSLLVFATFYVASGVLGAIAWWMKPVPLAPHRRENAT